MAICNAFRAFALATGFREFKKVTVNEFNRWYSGGNPLVAEGDVYFKEFAKHTVTVNECDGLWVCEVTDNVRCETGICEGFGSTPEEAWEATKKAIEDEPCVVPSTSLVGMVSHGPFRNASDSYTTY